MMQNPASLLFQARWITAPADFAAPVIFQTVTLRGPAEAQIALSALGFFRLSVNGQRVGDEYFLPSNSLFRPRRFARLLYPLSDRFTCRCYYSTFDLTPYLREGENLLEIALGDGWYRQTERVAEGTMAFGDALGAIFALRVRDADGERTILSDGSERCRTSATTYSQLFCGEVFDARIARGGAWTEAPVAVLELPETALTPEDSQPDRVVRRLAPRLLSDDGTRRIYDAGENVSGFVTLVCRAAPGARVTVRFAETLRDGALDFSSTGAHHRSPAGRPQIMEDTVIGDGTTLRWEPSFVWHAFRYFEIVGDGEAESVAVVHADAPRTADFTSDCAEMNWLFDAFLRTQTNNMHAGVPSDCPHRERLGYTGDGQVAAPAAMLLLDCRAFYRKWIRDIFDSQDAASGHVNHTAPFAGGGGGPGGWGCAAVLVPYAYYKQYGETDAVAQYYGRMLRWIDYLRAHTEDGLVTHEEPGGWCLGDWLTPEKTAIPAPFVNTCYLIRSLVCLAELARATGHEADLPRLAAWRAEAEAAVRRAWWDEAEGSFAHGVQGADVFALTAGLGDGRTMANLVKKYRALGRFDTGFLATEALVGLLFAHDETELAYTLLTAHGTGSFGAMMDAGATTVWEDWHGRASQDHPMFGACARHLLTGLLGITQAEDGAGWRALRIAPHVPRAMRFAEGGATLPVGRVGVRWERTETGVRFRVTLPPGIGADFVFGGVRRRLTETVNEFVAAETEEN